MRRIIMDDGAEIAAVPDGHFVQEDQPEKVAHLIGAWLRESGAKDR